MNVTLGKTEFTDAEMADLRDRVKALKAQDGLSWKQLGAVIDIGDTTIAAWVTGTYAGKNDNVAAKVHRYFAAESERDELTSERPPVPDFIMTTTAKRVWTTLAMAQQGDMTVYAGNPGLGKTSTIRQYKATRPNVWVVSIRSTNGGVGPMLKSLLLAMGHANPRGVPAELAELVISKVAGTKGLIVIDDAQDLTTKAAKELSGVHDATGVGVAFIGHLDTLSNFRPHIHLYSRLGARNAQRKPLREDLLQIAAAWGIEKGPELAFLLNLGRGEGGIRALTKVARNATFLARREGVPLHLNHLKDAASQGNVDIEG